VYNFSIGRLCNHITIIQFSKLVLFLFWVHYIISSYHVVQLGTHKMSNATYWIECW